MFYIKRQKVKFKPGWYYYENGRYKMKTKSGEVMTLSAESLKEDLHQQLADNDINKNFIERVIEWKE